MLWLVRFKVDSAKGGCCVGGVRISKLAHPGVYRTFSRFRAFPPFDVLTVYAGAALQTLPRAQPPAIVGKIAFSVSVRTSSFANHMQISCWEICVKFQDYREDKK